MGVDRGGGERQNLSGFLATGVGIDGIVSSGWVGGVECKKGVFQIDDYPIIVAICG